MRRLREIRDVVCRAADGDFSGRRCYDRRSKKTRTRMNAKEVAESPKIAETCTMKSDGFYVAVDIRRRIEAEGHDVALSCWISRIRWAGEAEASQTNEVAESSDSQTRPRTAISFAVKLTASVPSMLLHGAVRGAAPEVASLRGRRLEFRRYHLL